MKYFSFLVCFHEDHTDVFLSGAPIGVIRDGQFKLHQIVTPSGNLRDTTMRDLQNLVVGGCPFSTFEELRAHVNQVVTAMHVPSDKKPRQAHEPVDEIKIMTDGLE